MRAAIPYKVVGGTRFYDRREVKDLLAYVRLLGNPSDEVSARRIVNVPRRGIGDASVDRLAQWARAQQCSFVDALEHAGRGRRDRARPPRGPPSSGACSTSCARWSSAARAPGPSSRPWPSAPATAPRSRPRTPSRPTAAWRTSPSWPARRGSTTASTSSSSRWRWSSDSDELDDADRRVSLMTLHTAKGLEFPAVFLVGLEDGVFPHLRALDDPLQLEEERRLCYVGHHPGPAPAVPDPRLEPDAVGLDEPRHPQPVPVRASRRPGARRGLVVDQAPRPAARPVVVAPALGRRAGPAPRTGRASTSRRSATPSTSTAPPTEATSGPRTSTTPIRGVTPSPRPRSARHNRRGAAAPGSAAPGTRAVGTQEPAAQDGRVAQRHDAADVTRRRSTAPRTGAAPGQRRLGRGHLRPHLRPHDPLGRGRARPPGPAR